jgi:anaerobic magnesium-protoporphyrin IX monomethyl ester cyclase
MKALHTQFGVSHFWIADDIFGLNPKWAAEFKQEIQSNNLPVKLKIQSRADLLMQENYIQDLVESGVDEVWIGAGPKRKSRVLSSVWVSRRTTY